MELEDRVFSSTERPAFVTLKDHKPNFENNPKVLNPTKPEIGRISKQILASKVRLLRKKNEFNQWQNSFSVIDWFKKISNKSHCKFIVFDICEFYPSISEELLSKAVNWAKGIVSITPEETEIIFKSKQSLLWHKDEAWMKKGDGDVDVTMGSYDGAETCDLVGLYLLDQMKDLGIECGLYKDDGLAVSSLTRQLTKNVKKKICAIFNRNGLKIEIEANLTVVDYLDVTLNLKTNSHKVYETERRTPVCPQPVKPPSLCVEEYS